MFKNKLWLLVGAGLVATSAMTAGPAHADTYTTDPLPIRETVTCMALTIECGWDPGQYPMLPAPGDLGTLTNSISGVGQQGTPGYENTVPVICLVDGDSVVKVAYGQTIGMSNNASGGAVRMNGCTATDTYLGWISFVVTNGVANPNPYWPLWSPQDPWFHMSFIPSLVNNTISGSVTFTPIASNIAPSSTSPLSSPILNKYKMPIVGINLSGMEFGTVINAGSVTNLSVIDKDSGYSDLGLTSDFISAGINTVRLPISWGFLALGGGTHNYTINLDYWDNFVKPALETLTQAKIHTIIDLHTYLHYPQMGVNISGCLNQDYGCPDGQLDTDSQDYIDTWTNIYNLIKSDPTIDQAYLMFDLVSEPAADESKETLDPTVVFEAEVPVAKWLQDQGFTGYILLEGDFWSGLHSWTTKVGTDGQSNATVFTRAALEAKGLDVSKIIMNVDQYFDYNYSGTQNTCIDDLSTVDGPVIQGNGGQGYNLQAFADYLKSENLKGIVTEFGGANASKGGKPTCESALKKFITYLNTNTVTLDNASGGGFVGAIMWGAGHGWGGDAGYNLYIGPTSYQFTAMMDGLTLVSPSIRAAYHSPHQTVFYGHKKQSDEGYDKQHEC